MIVSDKARVLVPSIFQGAAIISVVGFALLCIYGYVWDYLFSNPSDGE